MIRYMKTFFFIRYFPADATAEMLEEWRPLMCPFDVTMQKAITYFEIFLICPDFVLVFSYIFCRENLKDIKITSEDQYSGKSSELVTIFLLLPVN